MGLRIDTQGTALVLYDEMCRAIQAAFEVDEVAEIRNKALAIEMYMRQQRNIDAEKRAIEIRLRAERKLGALLKETERARGRRSDLPTSIQPEWKSFSEQLADHGISQTQAHRWQKLAAVPADEFEATFARQGKASTAGVIGNHAPKKSNAVDDRALWLWGRLLDFERDGLLDADPDDICASMLDHMKETVRELAPRVAAWLERIDV